MWSFQIHDPSFLAFLVVATTRTMQQRQQDPDLLREKYKMLHVSSTLEQTRRRLLCPICYENEEIMVR